MGSLRQQITSGNAYSAIQLIGIILPCCQRFKKSNVSQFGSWKPQETLLLLRYIMCLYIVLTPWLLFSICRLYGNIGIELPLKIALA